MGRKGNILPMCLFPLDYECIFSVAEKSLGSCLVKTILWTRTRKKKNLGQKKKERERDCKRLLLSGAPSFHCHLVQYVKMWLSYYFCWKDPLEPLPGTTHLFFFFFLWHLAQHVPRPNVTDSLLDGLPH